MRTIANTFDPKYNSLNAIRLFLALLVIVSHSWPLGGYGKDPGIGDQDLGDWAVAGFFAISGYLITASRVNTTRTVSYYWRRFLRIYPAYIVATIVVALALAPLSAWLSGRSYDWVNGASYIVNNAAVMIRQWGISGTLQDVPYVTTWNGSAWTLFYELICYIAIGVAVSFIPRRFLTAALWVAFAITTMTTAVVLAGTDFHSIVELTARLGGFFLAGALIYQYRATVPMHWVLAVASGLAIALLAAAGLFQVLAGIPVAYLMLYLGARLPLQKLGARNDFSYGVYIYAFPVQQLLATAFLGRDVPFIFFVLASIVGTAPLAVASWFLVEKPAMRAKNLFARTRAEKAIVDPQPGPTMPASESTPRS